MTTPRDKFHDLMQKTRSLSEMNEGFNARGRRVFPFADLEYNGITTFKKLEEQMELIRQKKSNLSSSVRSSVVRAYIMSTTEHKVQ